MYFSFIVIQQFPFSKRCKLLLEPCRIPKLFVSESHMRPDDPEMILITRIWNLQGKVISFLIFLVSFPWATETHTKHLFIYFKSRIISVEKNLNLKLEWISVFFFFPGNSFLILTMMLSPVPDTVLGQWPASHPAVLWACQDRLSQLFNQQTQGCRADLHRA